MKYLLLLVVAFAGCTSRPSGPLAFVTNERGGTITVIDTKTDRVYSTIKGGGRLRGIRLSPDRKRIWVAISYPTNQSQLYTANGLLNDVTIIDTSTSKVIGTVKAGDGPWGIAI